MKRVFISDKIKEVAPETILGVIVGDIEYGASGEELWKAIEAEMERIKQMSFSEVKSIPAIATTREVYRRLGKEPSRYRPSAEALYRRIIKGQGLYRISNIVDTINLASLMTGYSIGGYDYSKIEGDVVLDVGREDDEYYAIGRGKINVANLPVFRDSIGAFGSPTTDSERTKIDSSTSRVMLIVMNFGGLEGFTTDVEKIKSLVEKYASGKNFDMFFVSLTDGN